MRKVFGAIFMLGAVVLVGISFQTRQGDENLFRKSHEEAARNFITTADNLKSLSSNLAKLYGQDAPVIVDERALNEAKKELKENESQDKAEQESRKNRIEAYLLGATVLFFAGLFCLLIDKRS